MKEVNRDAIWLCHKSLLTIPKSEERLGFSAIFLATAED